MRVRFWGVRGSIASPMTSQGLTERLREALEQFALSPSRDAGGFLKRVQPDLSRTLGGNTACVEVAVGDESLIFDAGTGIRPLGDALVAEGRVSGPLRILLSHFHWDHIIGFPFFAPVFVPEANIQVWSAYENTEELMRGLQSPPFFPVTLEMLKAKIDFGTVPLDEQVAVGGASVRCTLVPHPQRCVAYRVEKHAASFVYMTDVELSQANAADESRLREFVRGADLLAVDCMFEDSELESRRGWGHSSPAGVVRLLRGSDVKKVALFHHAPERTDAAVEAAAASVRERLQRTDPGSATQVLAAWEGLAIEL